MSRWFCQSCRVDVAFNHAGVCPQCQSSSAVVLLSALISWARAAMFMKGKARD